ncbi:hypothetical protein A1Q2_02211 [Trichosporon asahii var. asahii CBS 8904]|uniref:Uncharacterized protein n=1 Tax=Trichosporon asahii var. asahii (strain CBS 8904) TaxID=1220162 RepID=K1W3M6_TRIAC|nr:hypothetical protein A1Q2_02211 [Trichosporon asahii var. asahii CBS 8904]
MEANLETNAGQEPSEAKSTEQVVNDGKESRDKAAEGSIEVERGKEASNGALETLDSTEAGEKPPGRTDRWPAVIGSGAPPPPPLSKSTSRDSFLNTMFMHDVRPFRGISQG